LIFVVVRLPDDVTAQSIGIVRPGPGTTLLRLGMHLTQKVSMLIINSFPITHWYSPL